MSSKWENKGDVFMGGGLWKSQRQVCAFTLDVISVLSEKSRWHPRWHTMLNR